MKELVKYHKGNTGANPQGNFVIVVRKHGLRESIDRAARLKIRYRCVLLELVVL